MDLQLKGRRVLISGSSSGIGEGTARMLAEEGARVVIHGRNRERAEAVAAQIGAAGIALGDLSTDDGAASVHAQAIAALGDSVEILINNAGGSSTGNSAVPPLGMSIAHWLSNYHANFLAAVRLINHCTPAMVEAGFGRVINVSSVVAVQPNNLGADYSAAKAALNNMTVSLAGSLRNTGVTVNTVTPGIIATNGLIRSMRDRWGDQTLTVEQITAKMVELKIFELPPAGRLGIDEDLGMVICTLASPRSGFITGANYRVDGGQVKAVL